MSQTPFTDLLNVEERSDMDPRVLATADHLLSTGPLYIPLLRVGYRTSLDSPFISPEILLEEGRYVLHGAGLGSLLLLGREADIHTGRPLWFPEYYLAHRDCRTCSLRWEHLAKQYHALKPGDCLYSLHHGARLASPWPGSLAHAPQSCLTHIDDI